MADYSYNELAVFKLTFAAGRQLHERLHSSLRLPIRHFPIYGSRSSRHCRNAGSAPPLPTIPTRFERPTRHSSLVMRVVVLERFANGESVGFDVLEVTAINIEVISDPDASTKCDFFASRAF